MRRVLFATILTCAACSEEAEQEIVEPVEPVVVLTPKQAAQKQVNDLSERLERARATCENGPSRYDPDGTYAMAEVDLAMAESIDNVSPDQEQRIRASLAAEMGLAPSEVDGWRDIYRSRAEQGQRRLDSWEREAENSRRGACENVPGLENELKQAVDSQEQLGTRTSATAAKAPQSSSPRSR